MGVEYVAGCLQRSIPTLAYDGYCMMSVRCNVYDTNYSTLHVQYSMYVCASIQFQKRCSYFDDCVFIGQDHSRVGFLLC